MAFSGFVPERPPLLSHSLKWFLVFTKTVGAMQNTYFNPLWDNILENMIAQKLKYELGLHQWALFVSYPKACLVLNQELERRQNWGKLCMLFCAKMQWSKVNNPRLSLDFLDHPKLIRNGLNALLQCGLEFGRLFFFLGTVLVRKMFTVKFWKVVKFGKKMVK